jgi:hypothetical protein
MLSQGQNIKGIHYRKTSLSRRHFLCRRHLVGTVGIGSEVIAQLRGRRRSLAVGVDMAVGVAPVRPSA